MLPAARMQKTARRRRETTCALRSDFKFIPPTAGPDEYGGSRPSSDITSYIHEIECAWNNFKKLSDLRAHS
jgi:hypothetical protein